MPPMTVPRRGAGVAIFDGELSQRLLIFNLINYFFFAFTTPTFFYYRSHVRVGWFRRTVSSRLC